MLPWSKNDAIMVHGEPSRAWRHHRDLCGRQMISLIGQPMEEWTQSPHVRKLAELNEPANFKATVASSE